MLPLRLLHIGDLLPRGLRLLRPLRLRGIDAAQAIVHRYVVEAYVRQWHVVFS